MTELTLSEYPNSNVVIRDSKYAPPGLFKTDLFHIQLAEFSLMGHAAVSVGDINDIPRIQAEIDQLAARLWVLSAAELRDIQESLAELQ